MTIEEMRAKQFLEEDRKVFVGDEVITIHDTIWAATAEICQRLENLKNAVETKT
jgi:hypothetical protein